MSANLILHWMLDTLEQGNTISDETNNHLNGTITGNPQTVPEEKFGSCLCFDGNGDSITILDNATLRLHNYTAEVWIKPEQTNNWQGVLGKPGRHYNIWLGASGYVHHRFNAGGNWNAGVPNTEDGSIVWGQWYHVAITNDGQTARTYINGILKAESAVDGNLAIGNTPLIVGRHLDDSQSAYYKGCMAHLRLYDNVLTLEEIRRDMLQDESAASAFVRSHPIDFELYNEDNHHVLFIDNHPEGQTLSLDILNSSPQNIQLNDIGQTATSQAHHLELRFRPETLAPANLAKIKVATDGWSLDRAPDGTALYLLHQGSTTLEAGKTTSLQLTGMNADGRGGTRGTRVELVYQNMHYAGEESLLDGSRLQYLNIVNHQGRRNMPLHVGFVGSDTVLSDGTTPNTLRLRIANLSRDFGLPLSKGNPTTPPSRFRISFDVQGANETREWALTDYSKVDGASLQVTQTRDVSPNWAAPEKRNLGQTVEWTVAPSEDTTLGADGYIILELRNLVALTSIGHANIYINFENIPGYEDEQVVIVVQKSPLLFSNSSVGIGTNSPGAKLQIIHANQDANGNTLILGPTNQSNLRLGYHQNYSWIQSHGSKPLAINPVGNNVGIGIADPGSYKLNVEGGNTRLGGSLHFSSNQEIFFADNGQIRSFDNNHRILFRRNENKMELREYGDLIFSPGATSGQETVKMVILSNGNVGIGIADPGSYKLNVEGGDTRLGGALTVGGEIRAGNSDLYFTKADHNHTGIGNTKGYAAIENAANYDALMILGRAGTDKGRKVKLWDYLQVNGSMDITGTLAIGQTVIGERELQILKALASGMLEVDLYNTKQDEYLYAADYAPFDDDRRRVFTWRRKGRINQGRWRLTFPG
ncbi:LamG domain-containing protein [Cylindrospermum sp. FACHB-282]|uniref:LamG domain-containing protein n=1 Tax=Cylindrospermum sp. FACHB-282 TaxID=2692794 RepID=UPI001685812B|nr:LamG domain-containing protein [Cylindrospermum sp. FACHB-282]MBD2385021.1 LamG domain-containing protein [Cylindrospermum sp. FACHB-282]